MSNLWQGSGLPQAPFPMLQSEGPSPKCKLDHDSPCCRSFPREASRYWPGLQGLAQLGPCPPLQPPLHLSLPHSYNRAVRILPSLSAPATSSVWNALAAACFVSPRILLLVQQGPAQTALLQADFPSIPAVTGLSSWAPSCSRWTAQTPLLTWNLSVSSLL